MVYPFSGLATCSSIISAPQYQAQLLKGAEIKNVILTSKQVNIEMDYCTIFYITIKYIVLNTKYKIKVLTYINKRLFIIRTNSKK